MAKDTIPLSLKEAARLKRIGLKIRSIREKKNLTLEDVESRGYPSWQHLLAIEHGKKNLTVTSLFRLAKALEVSPESIISELK